MALAPSVTVHGNLQTITGASDAGSIVFELVNYGTNIPRVPSATVLVQTTFSTAADINGNFTTTLWGNDVIIPSGTYYSVTYLNESGAPQMNLAYSFTGVTTIDLSQATPIAQ